MNKKSSILALLSAWMLWGSGGPAKAATLSTERQTQIAEMLTRVLNREVKGGGVKITGVTDNGSKLTLSASINLSYYPFREESVAAIYDSVRELLPANLARRKVVLLTDKHAIEELIPHIYRSSDHTKHFTNKSSKPLVTPLSSAVHPTAGLTGRHIAMWQSHGRYFDQKENRWRWQRSRLWETCEDLYTQSYVLPYLVPMLEHAGANVLLPRERDVQSVEVIADNDKGVDASTYVEHTGACKWFDAGVGFAHKQTTYSECHNPFEDGTVRGVHTITEGEESVAEWRAELPESGEYAVYVSYRTVDRSADDACYTVHHLGGESRFAVNQTMGGGTWIYLGTFPFASGAQQVVVTLSNRSEHSNRVVTADAVKIGGGMGNIARKPLEQTATTTTDAEQEETSGYPRFCEGARYWLQWAGFPETVYRQKEGTDDYKEDYMSRSHWVNCLMGGSQRLPNEEGLHIPLDLALAFHSDAGVRRNDDIIGTLGIFFTQENKGRFEGGVDRYLSRDLADLVMTQIVGDIRATYEPEWNRRGLWNRSYYEARVPAVPTMLLELLSHQNFADMRYGNDPRFKFLVSRAIYKAMLRHICYQYNQPFVVQPLPVADFSATFTQQNDDEVRLCWRAVVDSLEATAVPTSYVLYTRKGDGGFDNGRVVTDTTTTVRLSPHVAYGFKITAANAGGESFPSEILSAAYVPESKGRVLIVNGFDRVSAPLSVQGDSLAGFYRRIDSGVADRRDISFIGEQRVYDRRLSEEGNDEEALGSCYTDYATQVIGGNTFDYPALHGASLLKMGYSFCSTSASALKSGRLDLDDYFYMDVILGKQRATLMGRGTSGYQFKAFPEELQQTIRRFTAAGKSVFVSGSYLATDVWRSPCATETDQQFAQSVLHYGYRGGMASRRGDARVVTSPAAWRREHIFFNAEPCRDFYPVESPDALKAEQDGFVVMRYDDGDQAAAVGYAGDYRSIVMGFPFESIVSTTQRDELMKQIMNFLEPRK